MRIVSDDPRRPDVAALIAAHLRDMHEVTPAEFVFALDVDGLLAPTLALWTARDGDTLLGCGALAELAPRHGEIKSMRTAASARGRGVGAALLDHLVNEARRREYARISLETGTQEFFAPARRLYARAGFVGCAPFGGYQANETSAFFTLELR